MDAKDIKLEDVPQLMEPGSALPMMIAKQRILVQHYVNIEGFEEPTWDLRLKKNQIEFKGFIFRVIEEMAEAYESFLKQDTINLWTELADATHFLLEMFVVSGAKFPQVHWESIITGRNRGVKNLDNQSLVDWFWQTTYRLGLVSNALRNKQWKQTEVQPDMHMFNRLMIDAAATFFMGFIRIGRTEQDIWEWYYRKNEVNKFRIKSKY